MKKKILIIMILTIVAKFTGFLREIVLSYYYGISMVSDAFLVASTIPGVIFGFITVGITTGYIPMYNKILEKDGQKEADIFTNKLINFIIFLCTCIVVFVFFSAGPIVKIFAMGFKGETLKITVVFTRIIILGIYFSGIVAIYTGFLQMKNEFIVSQLVSLPSNLIWVIGIYFASKYNDIFLPWGGVLAVMAQMLFLFPFVSKNGFKYNLKLDLRDKYLKELIILSIPIILGVSVNQINTLVDKNIASTFGTGGITALNYASRLNSFIIGLFAISIVVVLYPKISKMVVKGNRIGVVESLKESIVIINILVIPITIGSMLFSNEIVAILFGRGAFTEEAVKTTGSALFYYSVGMLGFGLREILSRVFYAYQDNKTPMINATVGVGLNIILNIILSKYMGLSGLALATSISAIITTIMMGVSLRKKIGSFGIRELTITTLKIIFSSFLMGFVAKMVFDYLILKLNANVSLILSVGIGGVIYIFIIFFMKIKDVDILVNFARNKLKV